MKKLLMLVPILLFMSLPASAQTRWSMGYYFPSAGINPPLSAIQWSALTHVGMVGGAPQTGGSITLAAGFSTDAPAMITAAHAQGVKVLYSLTNLGSGTNWASAASGGNLSTFITNIMATVNTYGFDGVDVDWEETFDQTEEENLSAALRTALGTKLLTMASVNSASCATGGQSWTTILTHIDRMNILTYDLNGTWEPETWFSAPLFSVAGTQSVDSDVSAATGCGYPLAKVGIGIPFYGYFSTPNTGPYQAFGGSPSLTQVGYDDMRTMYGFSGETYDTTAHEPWRACTGGNPCGATTSNAWITHENAQSITDKINYVQTNGLGGWVIWVLGWDYNAGTSPKMPLLAAVGAAFNRPTTYYIAANGDDANNGTSKLTPWLHAPGMTNCANTCAATTPVAADNFIFRGGDTWHFKAATVPATGGTWAWTWSGSAGNLIYVGVDKTWFTGGSWARPIMTGDNPTSTSFIVSCTFEEHDFAKMTVNSAYVTVDNFDWTGKCWTTPPTFGGAVDIDHRGATHDTISNNYFHGWTMNNTIPGTCCNDEGPAIQGNNNSTITFGVISGNVFDGLDSHCVGVNDCTGYAINGGVYEVKNNVFRYLSNGLDFPVAVSIHENLFEFMYESFDTTDHGDLIENGSANPSGQSMSIYGNVYRHTNIGVGVWPETINAPLYIFNEVSYDNGNPGNCYMVDGQGAGGTAVNVYFYNNTSDAPCTVRLGVGHAGQEFKGTVYFENNHLIGYSPATLSSLYNIDSGSAATTTITDNGNHVFQSEATANSQGFVTGNNYAPTSSGNATVGAGGNLTSSCSTFSSDSALCSGTSGGVLEGAGNVAIYPAITIVPRPNAAWNSGAYQFSSRPKPHQPMIFGSLSNCIVGLACSVSLQVRHRHS